MLKTFICPSPSSPLFFVVSLINIPHTFLVCVCVCVCVFASHSFWTSSSLDVPAGVTQEERSHRIFHPPSFCGACLNFSREKDSAIPFPRRPCSRILCTNGLIVLHPLGIFIFVFKFFSEKNPVLPGSNSRPNVSEGYEVPLSYRAHNSSSISIIDDTTSTLRLLPLMYVSSYSPLNTRGLPCL